VLPTKCNIRELYSYKKAIYSLTNVRSTGKTVYFTENGGIQVLEELSTLITPEDPPAKNISVPMNKVYSGGNSKLFAYEHHILVKGARRKVLYDYEFNIWRDYSYSETKITLGPFLKLKNGNWVEANLLAEENELSGNTLPEVNSLDKSYSLKIIIFQ
jgi:ribosome-associated protein YbcJ (S4-like RNA binding protein)